VTFPSGASGGCVEGLLGLPWQPVEQGNRDLLTQAAVTGTILRAATLYTTEKFSRIVLR
jgi:hypothetical protein